MSWSLLNGIRILRPQKSTRTREQYELEESRKALDRIWSLIEYDGRVPEDILDEIDAVLSAHRYGQTVANPIATDADLRAIEKVRRKK